MHMCLEGMSFPACIVVCVSAVQDRLQSPGLEGIKRGFI